MNIHHFYHVYADGAWQMCVDSHIQALTKYGLYNNLASFNIGFVGTPENVLIAQKHITNSGIQYNTVAISPNGWEQVTLDPLYEKALEDPEAYYVYAHTKGSANYNPINETWRKGMTRFNIVQWEKPVELLSQGYTTVGCHYNVIGPLVTSPYWGGNFWWASGKHIGMLGICEKDHRHRAESWVGLLYDNPYYKSFDLFPYEIGTLTEEF